MNQIGWNSLHPIGPNQCLQDFSNFLWIPNLEKLSHWVDPILVDYPFDIHDSLVHGGRFLREQTIDPMVSTTVVENDGR